MLQVRSLAAVYRRAEGSHALQLLRSTAHRQTEEVVFSLSAPVGGDAAGQCASLRELKDQFPRSICRVDVRSDSYPGIGPKDRSRETRSKGGVPEK